ncbi:MAG TPA: TIGR03435 family protein [Bryobacteraceae bacterium]|jgi:uncharacterized protein (TIGR03435 family)|nr:TIGR03435 family protein [Bryobacteraceae bacterium]
MKIAPFAVVLLAIRAISAQPEAAPGFEVATVKLAPPREGDARLVAMDTDPAAVRYTNVTLKNLIAIAYRFDDRLIAGGPGWLDTQQYDLAARLPPGTPKDRVPGMMQTLLAEQFHLTVHRESKEQRVYFLVAAKGGPKLKEAPKAEPGNPDVDQVRGDRLPISVFRGRIVGHAMPLGSLAAVLARPAGYQVVDRTGLAGLFDIDLKWRPDEDTKGDGPGLFTAIQEQLGLKLEPGRAPVETLVIDRAERIPAGN